jgi:hypothetical protein
VQGQTDRLDTLVLALIGEYPGACGTRHLQSRTPPWSTFLLYAYDLPRTPNIPETLFPRTPHIPDADTPLIDPDG